MPVPKKGPAVHPLVKALNPDPTKPPTRALKLIGLPGESPSADTTRLWLDADLTSYVDIPNEAILYSSELPDDAGTILWVAADATLTHGSVTSHAAQADFLVGEIATTHLAGAMGGAAPGGQQPLPPVTAPSVCGVCPSRGVPCVSLPLCPSEAMAPSHCGPCATAPGHCVSLPVCPSEAMAPSHCSPCVSVPVCPSVPCPSHVLPCPPPHTVVGCPSVQVFCPPPHTVVGCPSVHVLCPTPTAVACPSRFVACPPPSRLCPSIAIPCETAQACPSALCPQTQGCGFPPGGNPAGNPAG